MKPMPVWESLFILLTITILGVLCFYGVRPYLGELGLTDYLAYLLSISMVFFVMLVWSLVAYILEGNPRSFNTFLHRYRLNRFSLSLLPWSIGLGLFMFLVTAVFSLLISKVISGGLLPIPDGIPDYLNPMKQLSISQVKAQLINQGVLPLIPIVLFLNIMAEELFWRGMVFPRQELKHGQYTFLIHGSFWAISHLFQYWLLPSILVGSIALAYVIQRTKNTWVSICAHLVNNALPFVIMIFVST